MGARPDALTAAIEEAWRVFNVPAPKDLGVCTRCCMEPGLAEEILATPARDLTAHHLSEWLDAAYSANLSGSVLRWLLPRMFEIMASGHDRIRWEPEIRLARLPLTGFPQNWSEQQVKTVHNLCMALLDRKLTEHDNKLDAWLCMIAASHLDITPFLDRIWSLSDAELAAVLVANWSERDEESWILFSPFWEDVPACQQVWDWYTSPALVQRLRRMGVETNPRLLELAAHIERFEGRPPPV